MSLVGEDNFDEFIRPELPLAQIAAAQRYFNRKALATQVLLKHCPKCLRASSTGLMVRYSFPSMPYGINGA